MTPIGSARHSRVLVHSKDSHDDDDSRAAYVELAVQLLRRREEIIDRYNQVRSQIEEQVMSAPGDVADESVMDASADYYLRLANGHQHELVEIRDALERMHRGTYGECDSCENPIALERLKGLPYARMCLACKALSERKNPRGILRGI